MYIWCLHQFSQQWSSFCSDECQSWAEFLPKNSVGLQVPSGGLRKDRHFCSEITWWSLLSSIFTIGRGHSPAGKIRIAELLQVYVLAVHIINIFSLKTNFCVTASLNPSQFTFSEHCSGSGDSWADQLSLLWERQHPSQERRVQLKAATISAIQF